MMLQSTGVVTAERQEFKMCRPSRKSRKSSEIKRVLKRVRYDRVVLCSAVLLFGIAGTSLVNNKIDELQEAYQAVEDASVEVSSIEEAYNDMQFAGVSFNNNAFGDGTAEVSMLSAYDKPEYVLEDTKNSQIIRCMGYTGMGKTFKGKENYTGCIAGKEEWLGKTCRLYAVDPAGNLGEYIGEFIFDDTGYGLGGNIQNGNAICVWHPDDKSYTEWKSKYGNYVYMSIVE